MLKFKIWDIQPKFSNGTTGFKKYPTLRTPEPLRLKQIKIPTMGYVLYGKNGVLYRTHTFKMEFFPGKKEPLRSGYPYRGPPTGVDLTDKFLVSATGKDFCGGKTRSANSLYIILYKTTIFFYRIRWTDVNPLNGLSSVQRISISSVDFPTVQRISPQSNWFPSIGKP